MFYTVALPKIGRPRFEVIKWKDFFDQTGSELTPIQKKKISALLSVGAMAYALKLEPVLAAGMKEKIISAFDPVIDLAQGLSYPICFLTVIGGFLLIMVGQKSKGLMMIKWAIIGFLGVQFAPAIMKILVTVGSTIASKTS